MNAEKLDFESAALWRNRIRALTGIQANQDINLPKVNDADIIAVARWRRAQAVQIFFIGVGQLWQPILLPHASQHPSCEVINAFIGQFYNDKEPPAEIMLSELPDDHLLLAQALTNNAGHKVS